MGNVVEMSDQSRKGRNEIAGGVSPRKISIFVRSPTGAKGVFTFEDIQDTMSHNGLLHHPFAPSGLLACYCIGSRGLAPPGYFIASLRD